MAPKGPTVATCPGTVSVGGAPVAKASAAQEGAGAGARERRPPACPLCVAPRKPCAGRTRIRCCLPELAGCLGTAPYSGLVSVINTPGCWVSSAMVAKPFPTECHRLGGRRTRVPGFQGSPGAMGLFPSVNRGGNTQKGGRTDETAACKGAGQLMKGPLGSFANLPLSKPSLGTSPPSCHRLWEHRLSPHSPGAAPWAWRPAPGW